MKKFKTLLLSLIVILSIFTAIGCSPKVVEDNKIKVTLILDEGGVNDESFNQSAWQGAQKAQDEYNIKANYIESKQESDYKTNIETAIDQGNDLIIGVGFKLSDAIKEAAINYPEQKFAIIDGSYDEIPKNLRSILFNEEQAGYLAGLVAAKVSNSNKFGFIGGMNIPSVSNFAVGYEKAIKEFNPKNELLTQYANSFTDAAKGKSISAKMYQSGIDIIFTAGGGVNSGVYESGKEVNKLAVAVDLPQNKLAPDTILTSALKNVDEGVKLTVKDLVDGKFEGGQIAMFDISNGGVGYEKTKLIPEEVIKFVDSKINK